jgi:hypothetical protein
MSKIKDEQLQKLQGFVQTLNESQMKLGHLEVEKHSLLHKVTEVQVSLGQFQKELENEYGKVSVNIQDGTYTEISEDESNQEN